MKGFAVASAGNSVQAGRRWRVMGTVASSGVLTAAAFPGCDQWYLAWVSLVPLLLVLDTASPRQGFWRGYLAGLVYFGIVLSWMVGLVHWVGIVVLPGVALLVAYLALYWAMFGWSYCRLRRMWPWAPVLVGPFIWAVLEYLQSRLFTGFGWGLVGYTQIADLVLAHCATLGGVFLVSAIVVGVNLCLASAIVRRPKRWIALAAAAGLVVVAHVAGYGLMSNLPPADGNIQVTVVQGNFPVEVIYGPDYHEHMMDVQETVSERVAGHDTGLVVWPESALPGNNIAPDSGFGRRAAQFADDNDVYLVAGGVRQESGPMPHMYNTAFMFDPEGRLVDTYDKVHLAPYGEYIPLGRLMPFLGKVVLHISDVSPGTEMKVFRTRDAQFGPLICFETIFPELSRQLVSRGGQFIVAMSNLAWFGQTAAPKQEFAISRFRAIENHVPLVRAANTGISGIVGSDGRLIRVIGTGYRSSAAERIPLARLGSVGTFYTRHGDVFVLLSAAMVAATIAVGVATARKR